MAPAARWCAAALLFIGSLLTMSLCNALTPDAAVLASPQRHEGKFRNPVPMHKQSAGEMARLFWTFAFNKPAGTIPTQAIPVQALSAGALLAAPDNTLYRLGHSTMLIKLAGEFYL